jgi:hypothetical protein
MPDPRLLAAIGLALVLAGLTSWALYERSRYFECQAGAVALAAQGQVLAEKLTAVSDQVKATARAGQANAAMTRELLEEARRRKTPPDVAASDAAASAPAPAGKDCRDALAEIRGQRTTESRRAR